MTDNLAAIAVRILATANATLAPNRYNVTALKTAAAIQERQAAYRREGVADLGGGTGDERQRHSHDMAELADAGIITRLGNTRGSGAILTPLGEIWSQCLTACYSVATAWPLLELVEVLADHGDGFILETDILRIPHERLQSTDLVRLELLAEPFLLRGWLESDGDPAGYCGYAITPEGHRALAAGRPDDEIGEAELDEEMSDLYDAIYRKTLDARTDWQAAAPNNLAIPRSCCGWQTTNPEPQQAANLREQLFARHEG
jgi:hypothetical protein